MTIIVLFASCLFGFGLYHLCCAFCDIPSGKASKAMLHTGRPEQKPSQLLQVFITRLSLFFTRFIHLDHLRHNKIARALEITGQSMKPETYFVKAFVTAGLIALPGLIIAPFAPFLSLAMVGIAVTAWFGSYYSAFDAAKKWQRTLELEIPRFVISIAQGLENTRDVLLLLTSYRKVAGPELGAELDRTIADMKIGNYETALIHFETRIGSSMLSDVVRGLIGTLRGDDQRIYFRMLTFDMKQIAQSNLKKEAVKRPGQIRKYSMMMLVCILIIYLVVLGYEVITSIGVIFG